MKGEWEGRAKRSRSARPSHGSEFDFIERVRRRAASSLILHPSSLRTGIGDDAAVIRQLSGRDTVITADLLVEDVDFRLSAAPPRLLGHKALAVSLSDIAAVGARPRFSLLSAGLPREIWESDFLDQFYEGFFALADAYGVALVGGDVSRTPGPLVIDSVLLGETAAGRAVLRSGARPGDHLFVTGALGGAAAGFRLLEDGARLRRGRARSAAGLAVERLLLRQLRPAPRVAWGVTLGEERLATAMIDVSDGLSSDLWHLCHESGVGARIDVERLPVDRSIVSLGVQGPLPLALHGGEDFELLFTVAPRDLRRLPRSVGGVPATFIGDVTDEPGLVLLYEEGRLWRLRPGGFDHFGRR